MFQSPDPKTILRRARDEYQHATQKVSNRGDAWAIKEFTLAASTNVRRYLISQADFGKALLVATVPEDAQHYEIELEFTQLEQLPTQWAWLSSTQSAYSLWYSSGVSQSARYVAFFRQLDATGFQNYLEIRPTPKAAENYRILYQVGEWGSQLPASLVFAFPFPELDFYFVTLVANCLLPVTRWTENAEADRAAKTELKLALVEDLQRYQSTFDDFVSSLSHSKMVFADSFADHLGL